MCTFQRWATIISVSMLLVSLYCPGVSSQDVTFQNPPWLQCKILDSDSTTLNYQRLQFLLKAKQWQAADQETLTLLLKAVAKPDQTLLTNEDIANLPCDVLRKIDNLWLESSQNHFGFSAQLAIEQACSQASGLYTMAYRCFFDRTGWFKDDTLIRYNQLNFDLSAPQGHLPATYVLLADRTMDICPSEEKLRASDNSQAIVDYQEPQSEAERLKQSGLTKAEYDCLGTQLMLFYGGPLLLVYANHCQYELAAVTNLPPEEQAEQFFEYGNFLRDDGNLAKSETYFRRAITLQPNFARAYNNLGVVLAMQNKLSEAIVMFQNAIQLDAKHESAYDNLGHIYQLMNRFEDSIAAYQTAIQINDQESSYWNGLGISLRKNGDLDGAIAAYQKAISLHQYDDDLYNNLGIAYSHANRLQEAKQAFEKALELNPDNAMAKRNLSSLRQRIDDQ
ncbi:MAG: GUN4 domain-containing protein [Synechocystis sp.]|nr:GUN4 domain-containing protein [Synechocystis sp.]